MHEHPHEHDHVHAHKAHSPEEALALLSYMADHNKHHAEELHELAHDMDDASAALIHEAVELFNVGNEKLEKALHMLKGE